MRRFNVTGLCVPEEDYMVDISGKIKQIKELVDSRCYFTINRARQYGKTTTLNELCKSLAGEYTVISLSFQGMGEECFSSSALFCQSFMGQVVRALGFTDVSKEYSEAWNDSGVTGIHLLSQHISKMCENKKIVLIVDEVDRTSNNRVFLHFLDMLREKFLARKAGKDYTFHSVILAGVYDIKNIKLKMINEGAHKPGAQESGIYNSPWNIAADFDVDMSFSPAEIATMLKEYEKDHNSGMNVASLSEEIYSYTSGYPFLVSRICQSIDEKHGRNWTSSGVQQAVKLLLTESNTLFDDIFKNLENNNELSALIYDLLILRSPRLFVIYDSVVSIGVLYGFLKSVDSMIAIANKIFELLMVDYYISKDLRHERQVTGVLQRELVSKGGFDMELCLRKFAEHYEDIFSDTDSKFLERHGRLLFLSYLKPLINGQGFYHIESQLIDLRRMDIVVDFGTQQFIIELKLWNGKVKQKEAYSQLCAYLESKRCGTGYLLTFDFRKEGNKVRKAEWITLGNKRIFDVML